MTKNVRHMHWHAFKAIVIQFWGLKNTLKCTDQEQFLEGGILSDPYSKITFSSLLQ